MDTGIAGTAEIVFENVRHQPVYCQAAAAFGPSIDYAQLQKLYAADVDGAHRYSPPACVATRAEVIHYPAPVAVAVAAG